ncbi:MAG TPA: protein-methionine-sulfoxide reductase catalytic subunit MsrP [Gammaproteobacteria bacterium]|nr:protein-methionine-sulfoxide reductase catalytic subunit MsrP [Gammaproteobacteria bacterium]
MLIRVPGTEVVRPSEITSESVYRQRREFMQAGIGLGVGLALAGLPVAEAEAAYAAHGGRPLDYTPRPDMASDEALTEYKDVTSYNNFYEFGTDKYSPAKRAHTLRTEPWSVKVDGECEVSGNFTLEDILRPHPLEERIYRFRCVEGWSMVIPWVGIPLGKVLARFKPTSRAKFVEFRTLYDPKQMPGQKRRVLDWPYVEGLRIDEAMHPLTILAVGLYGEVLPNQNGAPLRLVVPWKYGFKSIKSIVSIHFTEKQPLSSWEKAIPSEYGFYSNVNPEVSHPRWSQRKERRIGEFFKIRTRKFNGYEEQVASLYAGMDLKKYF